MKLCPPLHKIRITKAVMNEFGKYLVTCAISAFEGRNSYIRFEPIREELLIFHTKTMIDQVTQILCRHQGEPDSKLLTITFSHGDRVTISMLARRCSMPPILSAMEFEIINKLTLQPT